MSNHTVNMFNILGYFPNGIGSDGFLYFALYHIVITSLGEEGTGGCAGCQLVSLHFLVSCFTTLAHDVRGLLNFHCCTLWRSFQCFLPLTTRYCPNNLCL